MSKAPFVHRRREARPGPFSLRHEPLGPAAAKLTTATIVAAGIWQRTLEVFDRPPWERPPGPREISPEMGGCEMRFSRSRGFACEVFPPSC